MVGSVPHGHRPPASAVWGREEAGEGSVSAGAGARLLEQEGSLNRTFPTDPRTWGFMFPLRCPRSPKLPPYLRAR